MKANFQKGRVDKKYVNSMEGAGKKISGPNTATKLSSWLR